MTFLTETSPSDDSIIGPFSQWPRRPLTKRRATLLAGGTATAAVFLHCVAPMLIGA